MVHNINRSCIYYCTQLSEVYHRKHYCGGKIKANGHLNYFHLSDFYYLFLKIRKSIQSM
jgi:hypothetical protein